MAKEDGQGSQLNLTVVALVALVAIVGLVALVLNTAGLARLSTGGSLASASEDANIAGQPILYPDPDPTGSGGGASCASTVYCRCLHTKPAGECSNYCAACPGGYGPTCRTCG